MYASIAADEWASKSTVTYNSYIGSNFIYCPKIPLDTHTNTHYGMLFRKENILNQTTNTLNEYLRLLDEPSIYWIKPGKMTSSLSSSCSYCVDAAAWASSQFSCSYSSGSHTLASTWNQHKQAKWKWPFSGQQILSAHTKCSVNICASFGKRIKFGDVGKRLLQSKM